MATAKGARREKSPEEVIGGIRRQIRGAEARAQDEDPWMIADMLGLAAELQEAAVRVVAHHRANGMTWDAIGFSLGITGTTACKRYAARVAEINAERREA